MSEFKAGYKTTGGIGVVLAAIIGVAGTWAEGTTDDINKMKESHNQDYRAIIDKINSSNEQLRKSLTAVMGGSEDKVLGEIEKIINKLGQD